MIKISRVFLGVTLLGSMVACSGSSADGGDGKSTAFQSSVVKSQSLAELQPEEATKYCEELSAWESERLTAALPRLCKSGAWWAAQFANTSFPPLPLSDVQLACTSSYDECIKTLVVAPPVDCSTKAAGSVPNEQPFEVTCDATVAEAEACHNELFDQYIASIGDAPACADITPSLLAENPLTYDNDPGLQPELGPACLALQKKCPDSLGGSI